MHKTLSSRKQRLSSLMRRRMTLMLLQQMVCIFNIDKEKSYYFIGNRRFKKVIGQKYTSPTNDKYNTYNCQYLLTINFNIFHIFLVETLDEKHMEDSKENISLLYQNLGCFKDDSDRRDLSRKVNLEKATQEDCAKSCAMKDKKFSYFGLQHGSECYCDMKYGRYGKVADDDCSMKCEGNSNENCGGENANNVFFFGLGKNLFK